MFLEAKEQVYLKYGAIMMTTITRGEGRQLYIQRLRRRTGNIQFLEVKEAFVLELRSFKKWKEWVR